MTAYRFYINHTYIGNSTTGTLSVNASNLSKYNGYYRCIPVNTRGEGEEKQQLVVVKGILCHIYYFYLLYFRHVFIYVFFFATLHL